LTTIRKLKEAGCECFFEKEGIRDKFQHGLRIALVYGFCPVNKTSNHSGFCICIASSINQRFRIFKLLQLILG
jgi:hypothetical protein